MTGSPALAHVIKATLDRLADGLGGPELAEVAGEVIAGRVDLRDVAQSNVYGEAFTMQISNFSAWYSQLDAEARGHFVAQARDLLSGFERDG